VKTRNGQRSAHQETRRTVIVAGAANILVGVVKLVAGILSGSSAMLAEAAHSAADTLDQLFLLTSLHQADRPADDDHPFGHGQERYFWSLLAAFGIFIAGAGFSFFEGILALKSTSMESPLWAYIALGVSVIAEGTSFIRAYSQVRNEARGSHEDVLDHVSASPDITVKVALFEDSAAVVGLIFAALGVGLTQLTGSNTWNGIGSIAIGVLLVVVAFKLGLDSKKLLVGRAANTPTQAAIREIIEGEPGVDELLDLRTMQIGPDSLIVAARIALNDNQSADQTEDLADAIDKKLGEKLPMQVQVYIDPTQTRKSSPPEPQPSSTPAAGPRTS
jgi:cation diffusion facilitator family transporter